MENKTKIILGLIGIIIVILIIAFTEIIKRDYKPNYLTKVICKEQPYEDVEYYYEKEPYTDRERYCIDRSWWSGDCISWDYRTITKYRDVRKSRTITKFKEVCVKIYFWKSIDFSENWLDYQEIYDRQGNRINRVVA